MRLRTAVSALCVLFARVPRLLTPHRLPTFFLSECVMVYMEPAESRALIRWVADSFTRAVFVTYEQIHPDDAFGRVMMENLAVRALRAPCPFTCVTPLSFCASPGGAPCVVYLPTPVRTPKKSGFAGWGGPPPVPLT